MSTYFFDLTIFEIAGVFGFGLYVMNYAMLTFRRLTSDCIIFYVINFSAASLVLLGLTASFNLAAALIQGFWIVMSVIAISLRVMRRL
jgi:hypothetical protein